MTMLRGFEYRNAAHRRRTHLTLNEGESTLCGVNDFNSYIGEERRGKLVRVEYCDCAKCIRVSKDMEKFEVVPHMEDGTMYITFPSRTSHRTHYILPDGPPPPTVYNVTYERSICGQAVTRQTGAQRAKSTDRATCRLCLSNSRTPEQWKDNQVMGEVYATPRGGARKAGWSTR